MAYKTSTNVLNRKKPLELVLELASFAGGENTIGTDKELKNNECRMMRNWKPIKVGGMERVKGFNEVATGGGSYTDQLDFVAQHKESTNTAIYAIIEGDLVKKTGSSLAQEDASAFTSGVLTHGLSNNSILWMTNSTDNIKYKTISGSITIPSDLPSEARDRLYYHKQRLIAEGGGDTIYGSRGLPGNWTAADAWTANNDAWSLKMPEQTYGCAPGFPNGDVITVFTEHDTYIVGNFPDVGFRRVINQHGCRAPYSVALGNEGVFFYSTFPTKGVFLWNGQEFINLTQYHDFIDDVNLSGRIFGIYKDQKYYFIYNELNSGVTYPNRVKVYETQFGMWRERRNSDDLADYFGYPALLQFTNNELYFGSSKQDLLYEAETTDDSDEGENTYAIYKTKNFTSSDFSTPTGGQFPIDEVRLKITKITMEAYGTKGAVSVLWTADNRKSGSVSFDVSASGDLINVDFVVNTSDIISTPPEKVQTKSVSNNATGRRFSFQVINDNTGTRPRVNKLKIHAIAIEEA